MNLVPETTFSDSSGAFGQTIFLFYILFVFISYLKLFSKANKPMWLAIIPFVNSYVIQQIIFGDNRGWTMLIYFIPVVGQLYALYTRINFCKVYGKSLGFGIFGAFFIGISNFIMAFSDAEYQGPTEHIFLD